MTGWTEGVDVKFSCDECNIKFINKKSLADHINEIHDELSNNMAKQEIKPQSAEETEGIQSDSEEDGEIKNELFETKHWKGQLGGPIGYSISHTKGQKNDFVKAVKKYSKAPCTWYQPYT